MILPEPFNAALGPFFEQWPLDQAMPDLVPAGPAAPAVKSLDALLARHPEIARQPALCAGLWLYVDHLDRSHTLSQSLEDATGSFWHAIMHRREGDFWNSKYWYRRAGLHPALQLLPSHDPFHFVDTVEEQHEQNPEGLVARQREEWMTLFLWCAEQAGKS